MLDIIGNIKIDESKPERIKYLIACIRSYLFLKNHCNFILHIDNASDELADKIMEELKPFKNWYFSRIDYGASYGKMYIDLLAKGEYNHVLNFFEDHFCVCDDVGQIKELIEWMKMHEDDICKTSFFKIEQNSIKGILGLDAKIGKSYQANEKFHNHYQKHYKSRYYIGVNFLTTREFALKFWNRDLGNTPHPYEIPKFDNAWLHDVIFPSFEFTCAIDDNHGEPKTCLLERTDCQKWNVIWNAVNLPVSSSDAPLISEELTKNNINNFNETLVAKLRNKLSPFYNLASMLDTDRIKSHDITALMVEEAMQAKKNKEAINKLLSEIEKICK